MRKRFQVALFVFSAAISLCTSFNVSDYCSKCVTAPSCTCSMGYDDDRLQIDCNGRGTNCQFPTLFTDANECADEIPFKVTISIYSYCFQIVPAYAIKIKSTETVSLRINSNAFHGFSRPPLASIDPEAFAFVNATFDSMDFADNALNDDVWFAIRNIKLANNVTINFNNNDMQIIRSGTFVNVTADAVILSSNGITTVETGAFTNCRIKKLNLSKNGIVKINAAAFDGSHFNYLDISYNDHEVNSGMFCTLQRCSTVTNMLDLAYTGQSIIPLSLYIDLAGLNIDDRAYGISLAGNSFGILKFGADRIDFKQLQQCLTALGMQLSEIDLSYCNIQSLPENMFQGFSAKGIDLTGNVMDPLGDGAFSYLTLEYLRLTLLGDKDYSKNFINSNISNMYLNLQGNYYDVKSAKCFKTAPKICSNTLHLPLCMDVLELLEYCENETKELNLYSGCECNDYSNLTFPVQLPSNTRFQSISLSTESMHFMDSNVSPNSSNHAAFTCIDFFRLQTYEYRFAVFDPPLCSQTFRSISGAAQILTLEMTHNYSIILPEDLLQFSLLKSLNVNGAINCTCSMAANFSRFFERVAVNAVCQDGTTNATEWVQRNKVSCANDVIPGRQYSQGSLPIVVDCGDWCKISSLTNEAEKLMIFAFVAAAVLLIATVSVIVLICCWRKRKAKEESECGHENDPENCVVRQTDSSSELRDDGDATDRGNSISLRQYISLEPMEIMQTTNQLQRNITNQSHPAEWKRHQLSIKGYLDKGYSGKVFEAYLLINEQYYEFGMRRGKHTVAAKKPDLGRVRITLIQTERDNLKYVSQLKHPNIIKFCGAVESGDGRNIYLCTEFCSGGSVINYLKNMKVSGNSVPRELQFDWASQICSGMYMLAKHLVIHCDLSARNILLSFYDGKPQLKISDFGLSRRGEGSGNLIFPWKWSAPENYSCSCDDGSDMFPNPVCTLKSDVWSYGVTLWEICTTGEEPFEGGNRIDVMEKIFHTEYRLKIPETAHPRLRALMSECWSFDQPIWDMGRLVHQHQSNRPSFNEIWNAYFTQDTIEDTDSQSVRYVKQGSTGDADSQSVRRVKTDQCGSERSNKNATV